MLRAGISMGEIDRTDLARYLRVLGHVAEHKEPEQKPTAPTRSGSAPTTEIYLRRGTIDEFW